MTIPDFVFFMEKSHPKNFSLEENNEKSSFPDFVSLMENQKFGLEKSARLPVQYGIGLLERAALPYDIAVSPLSSKGAQQGQYIENAYQDIERLLDQKQTGIWDEQDENLLQSLISQVKHPEESEKFVKTADISSGNIIEKASEALGYDIKPEGLSENVARITGNILKPKTIVEGAKSFAKTAPKLLSKEGRKELKIASQWKSLEKSVKNDVAQQEILDFSKKNNLTPQEATLLLQSKGKIKNLEKISKKTRKFKDTVLSLRKKLGQSYTELKDLGKKGGYLKPEESEKLIDELTKVLSEIDKTFVEGPDTKGARELIEKTIFNLENKAGTVEDLINSRRNLRQFTNWNKLHEGDALKERVANSFLEAIERKSPSIAKDLRKTDQAWGKMKTFEKIMEKHANVPRIYGMPIPGLIGSVLLGVSGLATGTLPLAVKGLIGKEVVQRLATRLLTDPKFQSIRKKMMQSFTSGSQKHQKAMWTVFMKNLKKEDPELFDEFDKSLKESSKKPY